MGRAAAPTSQPAAQKVSPPRAATLPAAVNSSPPTAAVPLHPSYAAACAPLLQASNAQNHADASTASLAEGGFDWGAGGSHGWGDSRAGGSEGSAGSASEGWQQAGRSGGSAQVGRNRGTPRGSRGGQQAAAPGGQPQTQGGRPAGAQVPSTKLWVPAWHALVA